MIYRSGASVLFGAQTIGFQFVVQCFAGNPQPPGGFGLVAVAGGQSSQDSLFFYILQGVGAVQYLGLRPLIASPDHHIVQ